MHRSAPATAPTAAPIGPNVIPIVAPNPTACKLSLPLFCEFASIASKLGEGVNRSSSKFFPTVVPRLFKVVLSLDFKKGLRGSTMKQSTCTN